MLASCSYDLCLAVGLDLHIILKMISQYLTTSLPVGGRVWDMIAMSQFALIAAAKDPENGVDAEKPS